MLESAIKKKILKKLRGDYPQGWWVKIHGGPQQERGIPDIIGCLKGKFYAFEVKQPGKAATLYQQIQLDRISDAGGSARVVTSYAEVKSILV
ncbi:MAG: VRR-NUC domain-containing protein [bacterium]|nr:VRR-NUC domain-containing protein [bacterium]